MPRLGFWCVQFNGDGIVADTNSTVTSSARTSLSLEQISLTICCVTVCPELFLYCCEKNILLLVFAGSVAMENFKIGFLGGRFA